MAVAEKINLNTFDDNREVLITVNMKEDHQTSISSYSLSKPYRSIAQHHSSDFDYSLESLKSLNIPDPDLLEDGEIAVASEYAFEKAHTLLMKLNEFFGLDFLYCSSTIDSRGGINLVWDNKELHKRIWVSIPYSPDIKSSIYCREGEENRFFDYLSSGTMMKLLLWLKSSRRNVLKNVL
jgi:hypothetical protein